MVDPDNVDPGSEIFLDSEDEVGCPQCGNLEFQFLGFLGRKEWLRCRRCGWDSPSEEIDPKCSHLEEA